MALDICPSLFFIRPGPPTVPCNEDDIFMPDRFRILQAERLTHVKEIVVNAGQPLQIRLLCCYRMKDLPENYCVDRHVDDPKKRVCDEQGIKNRFVHFHIKMEKSDDNEYVLAFIEGADLHDNIDTLVREMFQSITWLDIAAKRVFFDIFTFGEPVFRTRNTSYLDSCINSAKNKPVHSYPHTVEYDITHISTNSENRLMVSAKGNTLYFQA
jgi:hypothetical protein